MGVHGLTTWISKRSSLGQIEIHDTPATPPTPLVIDSLAFLYHTALSNSLRGGDYSHYRVLLSCYVNYWRSVGLEAIFVFDGPYEESKLATALHRSQQRLERSITYFRSSEYERGKYWVQRKAERLPILLLSAVLSELRILGTVTHFAEFEDSDYFIFSACGKGYVPLTSFEYGPNTKTHLGIHFDVSSPSVRFTTFTPAATARLLSIPPTYLPVFAALIGNDHSNFSDILSLPNNRPRFPGDMDAASLERVARTLASTSSFPTETAGDLEVIIRTVIRKLAQGKTFDLEVTVATLLRSALSYQLRPVETESPSFPLHLNAGDSPSQAASRAAYLERFRRGKVGSVILVCLKHGLCDPPTPVDDPGLPSPSSVFGAPIRLAIYAVLNHELHLSRSEIKEHNRRQGSLVVSLIPVPALASLLPTPLPPGSILSSSVEIRLGIYLTLLKAPSKLLNSPFSFLPHLPLLVALLHIQRLSPRPWPRFAILSAILTSVLLASSTPSGSELAPPSNPPRKESIQLSADLVTTLFHMSVLTEALDLVEEIRPAHECFEGQLFHSLLEMGEDTGRIYESLAAEQAACVGTMLELFQTSEWRTRLSG
ncbi:hypothetical protein P7C70_g1425, partial [Phenoliferia sp. Uapishka_3]